MEPNYYIFRELKNKNNRFIYQKKMNTTMNTTGEYKEESRDEEESRQLHLERGNVIIPCKLPQPFEQVEWVYPNDGESEFYSYEQMMNDWVPSDVEDDESSSDEDEDEYEVCDDDEYW